MELEIGHRYTVFIPSDPNSETTKQNKNCCVNSRESKCFINDINEDFVQSNLLIHFVIFRDRLL